ncbi:MAG: hypothetical protein EBU46_08935 [Nitrosomonadaceae bacterium]|nr:hypothetical protein [Nitrosomonadaceae bacterium]
MNAFERGFIKKAVATGLTVGAGERLLKRARMEGFNPMAPQPMRQQRPQMPRPMAPQNNIGGSPLGPRGFGTKPLSMGVEPQEHLHNFAQQYRSLPTDQMIQASQAMRAPGVGDLHDFNTPRMSDVFASGSWRSPAAQPAEPAQPQQSNIPVDNVEPLQLMSHSDPIYNTPAGIQERVRRAWAARGLTPDQKPLPDRNQSLRDAEQAILNRASNPPAAPTPNVPLHDEHDLPVS